MSLNPLLVVVFIFIYTWPAYLLPLVISPIILRRFRGDALSKPIAWLTLKPLLATPLWGILYVLLDERALLKSGASVLSLIPAVGLTVWIIWRFKDVIEEEMRVTFLLTGMDALRWLNTLIAMVSGYDPLFILGLILPNVYAAAAITILVLRARRNKQAVQDPAALQAG